MILVFAVQVAVSLAAPRDIPDNQVFLTFHNSRAGYSIKYPEGWQQRGGGADLTFVDKNNSLHVVISRGPAFTLASARADLARLRHAKPPGTPGAVSTSRLAGGTAFKATYTTQSAPSPVTGERVTLSVDRYYLSHKGKRAVVDLAGVKGYDNVDAYRLIIRSFRWS